MRVVVGGGEATDALVEWLAKRLDVPCELGDPLRSFEKPALAGRVTQWDVAARACLAGACHDMTSTAHEIDFLPADFRHSHARRRSQPWRIVVLVGWVAVVLPLAAGRYCRRGGLEARVAGARGHSTPRPLRRPARLDSPAELAQVQADAELYSDPRHPWPCTQVLCAMAPAPLPAEVTLDELEIKSEPTQRTAATPAARRPKASRD